MTLFPVRQFLAVLLLVCFGAMLPTAACPIRICLLEGEIYEGGFTSFGTTGSGKSKCCEDCGQRHDEDCCTDLKGLPDSTLPVWAVEMPAMIAVDLPPVISMGPPVRLLPEIVFHPSVPIRGPDSPGLRQAMLASWRI